MVANGENTSNKGGLGKPFFSGGPGKPTASYGEGPIGPGTQVGPFKLLGTLGEGGYGIVYLASQEQPIRRRVALKVIKPGMDSRQVIARFEAERQALALLDHPNIAHVYDAGATQTGGPYFAMEYVEGLPITEYCDREKLGIKDRLQLFLQVCTAVQHAHQKGIIHRDLKPSNILVTAKDDKPLIKVIDFGVAKALAQPLTEKTLYTEQGQFIGTPDYMSPEQAEMDAHGVDTRSDVYSLGVVLYELLTGVLPFDPDALRAGGVEHIRAVIREQEPRTPSTRLTDQGDEVTKIAQRRRTDPQTLRRALARELEWIPLKAMRKESSRRYQSVSELAEDVENYLRGAPLLAGPESVVYRARKFIQRHAGAVAAAALVLASLSTGFVVTTRMYIVAERLRRVAETAEGAEAAQRQAAEQERNRAVQAEQEATRRLVDLYEEQGRKYMEQGDLDRALVLLTEALKNDSRRISTRLLAQECLRTHSDPNLRAMTGLVPWKGEVGGQDLSFAISPDRRLIAFVSEGDGAVRIFDTETAEPRITLEMGKVSKLAFVPGNRYLLVRTEDGSSHHSIDVFDLNTGGRITSIRRANANIDKVLALRQGASPARSIIEKHYRGIVVSRDGGWFAFLDLDDSGASLESWVSLWDFSRNTLYTSERHGAESLLFGMVYRPPGGYGGDPVLAAPDCRSYLWLWKVPRLEPEQGFDWDAVDAIVTSVRMVGQSRSGELYLLDRDTNRLIRAFPHILAYGFSPDASRLVTQTMSARATDPPGTVEDVSVDLWDTKDGRHMTQLSDQALANWHFSPDGRFLIAEHKDAEMRVWFSGNGSPVFTIPAEANQEVADISLDGQWLLTDDRKTRGAIDVWSLSTGERFRPYVVDSACRDIGAGWLTEESDRVFSCSRSVPGLLARLNANGSAVICRAGLLPVSADSTQLEEIPGSVAYRVPLRFQDGRIRPASEKEIRLATINYYARIGAETKPEAVECLLGLVSDAVDQNDLTEASGHMSRYLRLPAIEDAQIVRRAQELKDKLSGAYHDLADREERCGRYRPAVDSFVRALRLRGDYPEALSRLAWLLATCSDSEVRDSGKALAESRRACDLTGWASWEYLSVYATACAANGAFTEAMQWQKRAIELLPSSHEGQWGENLRRRLQLFESRRPYDRRQFYNLAGENLLCWWTFESLDAGAFLDRSGRGHVAKVQGDIRQLTTDDRAVLQFCNADASLRCLDTPDLDVRDALTVIAWVRYLSRERPDWQYQQAVGKGDAWTLSVTPGTHRVVFECQGLAVPAVAPYSRVIGRTSVNDGRWHQIAAVYDCRTLAVFLDGLLDGVEEASGLLLVDPADVTLGQSGEYRATWGDLMRDVRIYNRAFSKEEVAEMYEASK